MSSAATAAAGSARSAASFLTPKNAGPADDRGGGPLAACACGGGGRGTGAAAIGGGEARGVRGGVGPSALV